MKDLNCLIDSAREILAPIRKEAKKANSNLAYYEGKIKNKKIKSKARKARLQLKRH